MVLADRIGVNQRVRRQRQHRLGIAGAEGTGARQQFAQREIGAAGGDRAVDLERGLAAGRFDVLRERLLEEGAERGERVLAQRHAGRHGMAAALQQQAFTHRLAHRAAEIDAGN